MIDIEPKETYCVICDGGLRVIHNTPADEYWVTDEICEKCGNIKQVEQ